MKVNFIAIIIIVIICPLNGQMISIGFGPTYIAHKAEVPLHPEVAGKGAGNDDWIKSIHYTHYWKNGIISNLGYSRFPITTLFNYKTGGYGWNGTHAHLYELNMGYRFFRRSNFIIEINLGMGMLRLVPNGYGIIGIIPREILPEGYEQTARTEAYAYQTTQITPIISTTLGYAIKKRVCFFLKVQQVYGHKKVQEIITQYKFRGEQQPDAIQYSDGTGSFVSLGVGYRFVQIDKL
jgi:hypothetical protein